MNKHHKQQQGNLSQNHFCKFKNAVCDLELAVRHGRLKQRRGGGLGDKKKKNSSDEKTGCVELIWPLQYKNWLRASSSRVARFYDFFLALTAQQQTPPCSRSPCLQPPSNPTPHPYTHTKHTHLWSPLTKVSPDDRCVCWFKSRNRT